MVHGGDKLGDPLKVLEVAVKRVAIGFGGARAGKGDLSVCQQVRQWRAQFMGYVGRERRKTLKRVVEACEHGVEAVGHFRKLWRHLLFRQSGIQRLRRNPTGHRAHSSQRAQTAARGPGTEQGRG